MSRLRRGSVNIYDIAREAGVSPVTVSRVYSKKAPVAKATRQRVLAVAERYQYAPSAIAQVLNGAKTRTIGMLWNMAGPHTPAVVVRNVALRMQRHDYVVQPHEHLGDRQITHKILGDLIRRQVDAVVFAGYGDWENDERIWPLLRRFDAAVVIYPEPCTARIPMDVIHHDRRAALKQIAEYFVARDRRRPALVITRQGNAGKIEAFRDHLAGLGVTLPETMVVDVAHPESPEVIEHVRQRLDAQFPGPPPCNAVMCGTDEVAAATMMWLRQRGLRVPEDVAVVGFNNSAFGVCLLPRLASVERHDDRLAELIEQLVLSRLEDGDMPARYEHVPMTLEWRESAG